MLLTFFCQKQFIMFILLTIVKHNNLCVSYYISEAGCKTKNLNAIIRIKINRLILRISLSYCMG